ncbi:MAG: c-type cytochrome [Alphaproteobacteria bacterium]|nr:c-type cytochrome [Alphaproteobacteria bacterium]MBU2271485.1 c-type cytochrome [Alphaproteobacteria bacterium]MBU2417194.1 c-type cytochrome [Alphaproteobacteria bacterium]
MSAGVWVSLATLLLGACGETSIPARTIAGADPARGLAVMERVGCAACHAIPGIAWPNGLTGPPLEGFAARPMIAGRLPNQPDVLTAWLIDPPALSPDTGMPPSPISEAEARDIAAYLYTLDER